MATAVSEVREGIAAQSEIMITFPDGNQRNVATGTTGGAIATGISKSLGKQAMAIWVDDQLRDLDYPIMADASVRILTEKESENPTLIELVRHDCAHVMAQAVQELFHGTQVTIGPAIENGFYYDFARNEPFHPDDLDKISERMRVIMSANARFRRESVSRDEARRRFDEIGESYKLEILEDIPEDEDVTIYHQGSWFDLCRGPHGPATGRIGAFKLMRVAGSYWRGDSNNAQLQRIYGTAFPTQKQLDAYLRQLEEAEKRDHRRLGREMGLFHFQEEAPGQVFWHNNGWIVYTELLNYMRRKVRNHGYQEINTPQLLDSRFWVQSGHWDKYHDNMFIFDDGHHDYPAALKPMSCPGGAQVFKADLRSYRDLPLRLAEFGSVFRKEASGARHGLMRVQAFTQDDAHIFCRDDQLEDEVVKMCDLIAEVYNDLGMASDITVHFATRPEQRIGREEDWDRAEAALRKVLDRIDMKWELNEGDGAFYAPKLDFKLRDAIGREWQCGTVQVDMNMPHRLDLEYIGDDGAKHTPHMVHRAILGSVERFIGVMIEHYAGRLPIWLAPVQAVVATVTNDADDYARKVASSLEQADIRVKADTGSDKIGYKVRLHSHAKVPIILAVGGREAAESTVSVRRLGSREQESMSLDEAIIMLQRDCAAPDISH
ncbi:MAG: threonine--tRNA ligase [Pseudomonadota bacterium]